MRDASPSVPCLSSSGTVPLFMDLAVVECRSGRRIEPKILLWKNIGFSGSTQRGEALAFRMLGTDNCNDCATSIIMPSATTIRIIEVSPTLYLPPAQYTKDLRRIMKIEFRWFSCEMDWLVPGSKIKKLQGFERCTVPRCTVTWHASDSGHPTGPTGCHDGPLAVHRADMACQRHWHGAPCGAP